jgi:hypothetical protein
MQGIVDLATYAQSGGGSTALALATLDELDLDEGELPQERRLDYVFTSVIAHRSDPDRPIAEVRWRVVVDPERGWQLVRLADDGRGWERVMRGSDARIQQLFRDALALLLDETG